MSAVCRASTGSRAYSVRFTSSHRTPSRLGGPQPRLAGLGSVQPQAYKAKSRHFAGLYLRQWGMARTGPSAADRQLINQLAARGLSVSAAQLERWRHAGLLARNSRRGCGRGRGSVSKGSAEAVEIAAALSRNTRQGRDLRLAVIDWFAEAGKPTMPGETAVPEPPHNAVLSALTWLIGADPVYQLLRLARSACTEEDRDKFYDAADGAVPRSPLGAGGFDPAVVREAVLSRRDPPDGAVALCHLRARRRMTEMLRRFR